MSKHKIILIVTVITSLFVSALYWNSFNGNRPDKVFSSDEFDIFLKKDGNGFILYKNEMIYLELQFKEGVDLLNLWSEGGYVLNTRLNNSSNSIESLGYVEEIEGKDFYIKMGSEGKVKYRDELPHY
jgi:hypothetical protein